MPKKIYAWHTTQSGTARSTSRPSENASMMIRYASSASESPSPTKTRYNFISNKCKEWENKSIAIKDDFDKAKLYFEPLVKDYKVYAQNSNGTAGKHNFESMNQATKADAGDELRKYIAGIAQAVVTQEEQAANIQDSSKASSDAMAAQIKTMSNQIAQLTKTMANKENTLNGGGGSGGSGGGGLRDRGRGQVAIQYEKPRSMGY